MIAAKIAINSVKAFRILGWNYKEVIKLARKLAAPPYNFHCLVKPAIPGNRGCISLEIEWGEDRSPGVEICFLHNENKEINC